MKKEKQTKKIVGVSMDKFLYDQLKKLAKESHRSVSSQIITIIEKDLKGE